MKQHWKSIHVMVIKAIKSIDCWNHWKIN